MEFQAIVLAGGRGNGLTALSSHTPKCLLPVGNKPMIWYPVCMLEKAGFKEINIITLDSIKSKVRDELVKNGGIKASLNIVGIDDSNEEDDLGTANSLYLLKDKIVSDCMIVSCDLISNVHIQSMANFYRVNNAAFLMLAADITGQNNELSTPGVKKKYSPERDFIGFDVQSNRLLYFDAEADVENNIKLKSSILHRYPKITWTTKLQDAHFYIIKKCLIDYIIDNKKIFSLKGDFVPLICRKQFSTFKPQINDQSINNANVNNNNNNNNNSKKKKFKNKIFDYLKKDELLQIVNKSSSNKSNQDLFSCYLFLQTEDFCYRTNNLAIYAEANRQIKKKIIASYQEKTDSVSRHDKSQIDSESLVGDEVQLGEKAIVKHSVIGRNCKIGEKTKITNSVIMDNVTIEDNVTIQSSVVCSNSKIVAKTEIKDCVIGYSQEIVTPEKYSNETINDNGSFMDD